MAMITDSLRGSIEAAGRAAPFLNMPPGAGSVFTSQLAIAAYLASGMMRKVVSIPAEDRIREWRDWQAEADTIKLIEAEEERLHLQAKTQEAELLRGIGGGAIIVITTGDHSAPLTTVGKGGIVALNVVSRWEITGKDWVTDLASPDYGKPLMWEVNGGDQTAQKIHPSRVIAFRGPPLPAGASLPMPDRFWGDSRLLRVFTEVQRSDNTQGWFATLVQKAKLLRISIPNLIDILSQPGGQEKLNARIALIATGESTLNATVLDAGDGQDGGGEKLSDYQVNWAGIPAMMDAFDQRVAAVADIPFTRLMGRSPAGMNATGAYDDLNWNKTVTSGQKLELGPCLKQLDPLLLQSAGVTEPDVWWQFAPLSVPSEKEDADTFLTTMTAVEKLIASAAIPEVAMNKGVQNLMAERGWVPGLEGALAELPEDERFGLAPDDDGTDPSELQAESPQVAEPAPRRRAANDGKSRSRKR